MTVLGSFAIYAKQLIQSWTAHHVLLSNVNDHCLHQSVLPLSLHSPPVHTFDHGNFRSYKHVCVCPYFSKMAAILFFSLFAPPPNINLELSYLAQIYICFWVNCREGIIYLWAIFLKLFFF